MKFETIEDITDLKVGDTIVYISDLYKWESRQLKVTKITDTEIICNNSILDIDDELSEIVKVLKR